MSDALAYVKRSSAERQAAAWNTAAPKGQVCVVGPKNVVGRYPLLWWVPIRDYDWDGNFDGGLKDITCRNHPTARYSSKHPRTRSLHFLQAPDGFNSFEECPCGYDDLVVIVEAVAP